MIKIELTIQEAFTIYGLLEGALNRMEDANNLNNPELIERTMTDIMMKLIHQFEDNNIISKID